MFLNNWYKILERTFRGTSWSANVVNMQGNAIIIDNSGRTQFANNYNNYDCPSLYYIRNDYASAGVILGTGNTPPTPEDYALSGEIITNFAFSAAVTIMEDAGGCTWSALYTITNTADTDITIREIALMVSNSNYTGKDYHALIERTVLDSPVTIPAGGVGVVTYTIRMNYPTV